MPSVSRCLPILGVLASAACQPTAQEIAADAIASLFSAESAEWVDMSYAYDESTIFWPTAEPFQLSVVAAGITENGYYHAANNFSMAEHGGTHLDAPIHFAEGRETADQIPLRHLVGPAIVVDISASATADPDYRLGVADFEDWEVANGRIPDGSILLVRTGWGARWPDRGAYLGTDLFGAEAVPELHFPGIDPVAAGWLVENRNVAALGIDTPSIDYGQSTLFETHRILFERNIPGFENVAALGRLPLTGAYVIALPMKIRGGSGAPLRIVGVIPRASG